MTQPQELAPPSSEAAHQIALYSQRLVPGHEMDLASGHSVVYTRAGTVTSATDGELSVTHQSGEAWWAPTPTRLISEGATAWIARWTLSLASDSESGGGELLLVRELSLNGDTTCLLRCDQVDFPPGGIAYLHTHAGPGIRMLISGSLRVETEGESHEYSPGDCWFEPGPIPVFAQASRDRGAMFVRVMVLPIDYKGRSSISYQREEDRQKPKRQRYSIYVDQEVTL